MHRRVSDEIYRTRGGFYVTRVVDGEEHVIDRFDDRARAENFVAFLNEIADAPRGASRCIDPIGCAPQFP